MIRTACLTASVSQRAGGLFDAVLRLVQVQHQQGREMKVFGLWDDSTGADLQKWSPVPVAAFRPSWPKVIGRAPELLDALHAFAPDLCHVHGLWLYPSIAAKHYSRTKKRPCLISPHGMLDPWAMRNSRWKKQIAWSLFEGGHLRGAQCLRALCVSEARSIRQLGLKNPIAIIPNGIDLPADENADVLKGETPILAKLKTAGGNPPWQGCVEPGKKVLLFLSRIHPKKGLVNLLRAWGENRKSEIGRRTSDEWVLAIAGWDQGGHEAELKTLATELGLAWRDVRARTPDNGAEVGGQRSVCSGQWSVLFLGPQFNADKAACYRHCDAFVLPSFSEGLPMVVLEAWANSKPVLMTPECNLPEGFKAGAALKVAATEAGIASGLSELQCLNEGERQAMGRRARALVAERFTWAQIGHQLQAVEEWMLGGGAKPDGLMEGSRVDG